MAIRARWLAFYSEHVEPVSKEFFSYVERMIIGTLIVSAGAHVSSNEPAIVLFGYLRHGLVGRGVELFGVILLIPEFSRWLSQTVEAQLARRLSGRVVVLLFRAVDTADPAYPGVSRRVAGDPGLQPPRSPRRASYCALNCASTS